MTDIGVRTAKMVPAEAVDMTPPTDPPPGLIPVPMKGAVLLLTAAEFTAAVRRGKFWRRREAMLKRTKETVPTAPSAEGP